MLFNPFAFNRTTGVGHSLGANSLGGLTRNLEHRAEPIDEEIGRDRVEVVKSPKAEYAVGRTEEEKKERKLMMVREDPAKRFGGGGPSKVATGDVCVMGALNYMLFSMRKKPERINCL